MNLQAVEALPAWTSNRLQRLTLSPKRYRVAPRCWPVIRVTESAVLRDGDLLGRVLDTFVAAQLRVEVDVAQHRARRYHLRQEPGRHEIDLLAEIGAERVIGMEVKATSAPDPSSAASQPWFKQWMDDAVGLFNLPSMERLRRTTG